MRILFLESEKGRYMELKYASCVASKYADKLRKKGHTVMEVRRPSPDEANAKIRSFNPDIIWFVGHGYMDRATLEELKLWVTTSMPLDQFRGRIVVAHSCLTGLKLGKVAVQRGALGYFGYTDEMWFMWCDESRYDNCACTEKNPYGVRPEVWKKLVTYPHYPSLEFIVALTEGKTMKEAFDHSIAVTDRLVEELESIEPASETERSLIKVTVWAMKGNQMDQVLYAYEGGEGKVISTAPSVSKALIGMLMISLPVVGLAMFGGDWNAGKEVRNI